MAPRPDTFIEELTEEGRQPPRTFRNPGTEARRAELGPYYRAIVARFRDMVMRARPNPPLGRLHPNRRLVLDRRTGLPVVSTPSATAAAVTSTSTNATTTAVPATEGSGWDMEEITNWDDRMRAWDGEDTGPTGWVDDDRTGWHVGDSAGWGAEERTGSGWDAVIEAFGRVVSVSEEMAPAPRTEQDNAWERALTHPDVQRIVRGLRDGRPVPRRTSSSSGGSPPPLEEALPHEQEALPDETAASAPPAGEGTPPPPREPTAPPSRERTPPPPVVGWGQMIESRAAFTDRVKAEFLAAQKACKNESCTRGIPCKDCAKFPGSAWFMIGETFIDEYVDDAATDCGSVLSVTPPPTPAWYAMSRQHDFELFYHRQEEREGQRHPMF